MSSASWTPVTNGNSATWSKNKTLTDLQDAATLYDDSTITYDSIATYYDGYNPTTTTPEGENPSIWTNVSNASSATWAGITE